MPDAMGNVTVRDLSKASGFTVRQLRYLEDRYHLLRPRYRRKLLHRDAPKQFLKKHLENDPWLPFMRAWRAFLGERQTDGIGNGVLLKMLRDVFVRWKRHQRGVTKYYRPQTIRWVKTLWAKSQEGLSPAELKEWAKTRFDRAVVLSIPPVPPEKKSEPSKGTKDSKRLVA